MRVFGMSVLTLVAVLAVGYMLAVLFPGFGNTLKAKLGIG